MSTDVVMSLVIHRMELMFSDSDRNPSFRPGSGSESRRLGNDFHMDLQNPVVYLVSLIDTLSSVVNNMLLFG